MKLKTNFEIKKIALSRLKEHEQTDPKHLKNLTGQIASDGYLKDPIIVDKATRVILDGHHRFNAAKKLGLRSIPACLVDYQSKKIGVTGWRAGETITKQDVLNAGLSGKLLKPKTSRHLIKNRPLGIDVPLSILK